MTEFGVFFRRQLDDAHSMVDKGDAAGASRIVRAVLKEDPSVARAHALMGLCHLINDERSLARSSLDNALALDETDEVALIGFGYLCQLEGDLSLAQSNYEAALAANPQSRAAQIRLEGLMRMKPPPPDAGRTPAASPNVSLSVPAPRTPPTPAPESKRGHPARWLGAVVVVTIAAVGMWVALGGPPEPTPQPVGECQVPAGFFPGEVQPFTCNEAYGDDRVRLWSWLLVETSVIPNYPVNCNGCYLDPLPDRVRTWQDEHGFKPDGVLNEALYDCLWHDVCPNP